MENILAIDLGGTSAKCAVFSQHKEIILEFLIPTNLNNILLNIKHGIDKQFTKHQIEWSSIKAIGFAIPGFLDDKAGVITLAGNLGWKNFNIRSEARAIFNKEIYIINDVNAAALGEYWCGDHGASATLALYTLGTGIGGGLILNGNLWTGTTGYAGEFGHGGHFQDKYPCTCGLQHCIEPVSSATGLTKLLNEQANQNPESSLGKLKTKLGHHLKLLDIKELFEQKDLLTTTTITEGLIPLASHIAIMLYILNPQAIILAGGVTNLGGNLAEIINDLVKERIGDFILPTFKIEISKLQAKAGMYGLLIMLLKIVDYYKI